MNQRDHLYQVQKNTGKEEDQQKFKKVKYEADCMIKLPTTVTLITLSV